MLILTDKIILAKPDFAECCKMDVRYLKYWNGGVK